MLKTLKPTKPGQKPIKFNPGGLHRSLGVAPGKPIPPGKRRAALAGRYGPKARRQALFAQNVLTGPKGRKGKKAKPKPRPPVKSTGGGGTTTMMSRIPIFQRGKLTQGIPMDMTQQTISQMPNNQMPVVAPKPTPKPRIKKPRTIKRTRKPKPRGGGGNAK